MLEIVEVLPERVIGVSAKGRVTADDYQDVLIPELERKAASFEKLRLLYVFGKEFETLSAAAAWEDTKVAHLTYFDRIAVVSDLDWIERMVQALGFMLPGEVRVYGTSAQEQAKAGISEPPRKGTLDFELDRDRGILVLAPSDELEAGDFERVAREVDPYIEEAGSLAGVVIVADRFPGWDDFSALTSHFRFVRDHRSCVRRVALVTCSRFLSLLPRIASAFIDAEVKRFGPEEPEAAVAWVALARPRTSCRR